MLGVGQQKFPERLERWQSNLPLIYVNQLGGGYWQVADSSDRNSIPIAKRARGMMVSYQLGSEWLTQRFEGSDTSNTEWLNGGNWVSIAFDTTYLYSVINSIKTDTGLVRTTTSQNIWGVKTFKDTVEFEGVVIGIDTSKWELKKLEVPYNYGNLYNWYAVNTGKLAPTGWHVPTDAEWTILTDYLGTDAGGKLKSTRITVDGDPVGWNTPNTGATNETDFTALPGGLRPFDNSFTNIGLFGYWWSATEFLTFNAWSRNMLYHNGNVFRNSFNKKSGFSVRCLRDDLVGYVEGEIVTDVDGNIYNTVRIGDQVWMTQNLKTTKYNDGTSIPSIIDDTDWSNDTVGAYCTYNNDPLITYEDSTYFYTSELGIQPKNNKYIYIDAPLATTPQQLYYDTTTKAVSYGHNAYGFYYVEDSALTLSPAVQSTFYHVTNPTNTFMLEGDTLNVSMVNDIIKLLVAGKYNIRATITFTGSLTKDYSFRFMNNLACKGKKTMTGNGPNNYITIPIETVCTATANEEFVLQYANISGTEDIIIRDLTITITKID